MIRAPFTLRVSDEIVHSNSPSNKFSSDALLDQFDFENKELFGSIAKFRFDPHKKILENRRFEVAERETGLRPSEDYLSEQSFLRNRDQSESQSRFLSQEMPQEIDNYARGHTVRPTPTMQDYDGWKQPNFRSILRSQEIDAPVSREPTLRLSIFAQELAKTAHEWSVPAAHRASVASTLDGSDHSAPIQICPPQYSKHKPVIKDMDQMHPQVCRYCV